MGIFFMNLTQPQDWVKNIYKEEGSIVFLGRLSFGGIVRRDSYRNLQHLLNSLKSRDMYRFGDLDNMLHIFKGTQDIRQVCPLHVFTDQPSVSIGSFH